MTEAEIFAAAIKLSGDARHAYLEATCSQDAGLREQVEALLKAHDESVGLLPKIADVDRDETREITGQAVPGVVIAGRYKLLEQIGEGGMGTVWVAEQSQPVKRKVALKLIKAGMDSKSVLARFEAERQALALMDHPNIAKVLDGGLTETGRPYFVMDYVKGVPITEYCDATRLSVPDRLQLFVQVCQAVQHAHQKGIIHRDLKPSNILVAPYDDKPVPKVIDFGLAKAMNQSLTEKTLHTAHDMVLGTPQYMSPEQATFNNLDIDTRSDVYSLGTLLYELLAGSPPFAQPELEKRGLLEILRVVREEEPPRPSLKLSTAAARASISANRGSEPLQLTSMMRGELDWIVMRALEKDRTRRYDTAIGFAADIQRYLAGEQVQAVPPSLGYRLKKAYRRNRAAVLVGTAFTFLLMCGVAVSSVLAIKARRAKKLAEESMKQAVYNQAQADAARDEAIKNEKGWVEATWAYKSLAVEAEVRANSARIDADLLEYKSDARVGLLRLARPLKDSVGPIPLPGRANSTTSQHFPNEPELVKLREFQAAAVITAGQQFVPLVPPLHHNGNSPERSREQGLSIIGDERYGLQLIALPSLQQIGVLRESNERLVKWGFSPDGKTIYTQDTDSIVRFWNADGKFRAKTPIRPERFVYPAAMTIQQVRDVSDRTNSVRIVDGIVVLHSQPPEAENSGKDSKDTNGFLQPSGPHDLYSTRTGQFIRRLDRPDCDIRDFKLVANDRWLIYYEYDRKVGKHPDCQLVIVSTDDGRELARLPHSTDEPTRDTYISPTGKWVVTLETDDPKKEKMLDRVRRVRLWNSANWQEVENETSRQLAAILKCYLHFDFVTDDIITARSLSPVGGDDPELMQMIYNILDLSRPGYRRSGEDFGKPLPWYKQVAAVDGSLIGYDRTLVDARTFERIKPPSGRMYHPDLATLAPDGRFSENLDTVTEKELPLYENDSDGFYFDSYGPGFGQFGLIWNRRQDWYQLYILPDPVRLTIPPAMLELWAQVVTGGELGSDGLFKAWDEPKWIAKQKELAAMTQPYADFPFPGWVATEPHLWWRIQPNMTQNSDERNKLLDEWRRRSGRVRPKPESDTWRTPGPAQPTEQSQTNTSGDASVSVVSDR